jgi:hypothetical protein
MHELRKVNEVKFGQIGGEPNLFEGLEDHLVVIDRLRPAASGFGACKAFEFAQQPDGVFAMKASGCTELVQDAALVNFAGLFVTQKDGFDVFAFGSRAHDPISLRGNSPVTWNMSQRSFSI